MNIRVAISTVKDGNMALVNQPSANAIDNRGLKELVFEQMTTAKVLPENITDKPGDTTGDANYFSHSEFLKGHQETDDRYAIMAVMNPNVDN